MHTHTTRSCALHKVQLSSRSFCVHTSSNAQSIPQRRFLERLSGHRVVLPPCPLGRSPIREQPFGKQRLLERQVAELVDGRQRGCLLLEHLDERYGAVCCCQLLPDPHALAAQGCADLVRCELAPHTLLCQHVGNGDLFHHLQRPHCACVSLTGGRAQRTAHGCGVQLDETGWQAASLLTMCQAQDEHGQQHWCVEDLFHEHDHALEQRIELRPV
eukprot:3552542-Prymnesium_polylepis.2